MRIAIACQNGQITEDLSRSQTLRIYEDDHGKIKGQSEYTLDIQDEVSVLTALERCGADVVLCAHPTEAFKQRLAAEGILLLGGFFGSAEEAALSFLNQTVAFDPSNGCNACGHGHCSSFCGDCQGCGDGAQ